MEAEDELVDTFEVCLVRLGAGEPLEVCLAAYPQHRAELEAPLRAAARVQSLPRPVPSNERLARVETQVLAQVAARRTGLTAAMPAAAAVPGATAPGQGARGRSLPRPAIIGLLILAALLALALGYGLVRLVRPQGAGPQTAPTAPFAPATTFTLEGPIEQLGEDRWTVRGMIVAVDAQTQIEGVPAVGATARLQGKEGPDLLKRLNDAQEALAKGDREKAGKELQDLRERLHKGEGGLDATFAQQAQASIDAIAVTYSLTVPMPEDKDDNGKEDDKGKEDDGKK
jgi:hypothetical protein